jgi:formamidopyrimidine-DNA glycosylase
VPELPDVELYVDALRRRLVPRDATDAIDGDARPAVLERVRLASPFLLRTVTPPLSVTHGRTVTCVRRLGKRVVIGLGQLDDAPLYLVIHLMIAGRLQWKKKDAPVPGRIGLAMFDFATGSAGSADVSAKSAGSAADVSTQSAGSAADVSTQSAGSAADVSTQSAGSAADVGRGSLAFTEASKKKRAKLHVVHGDEALDEHDPGGAEPLSIDVPSFAALLRAENHTIKRTLTDPRVLSGIGNAYSDEILFAAKLPPHRWTTKLTDTEVARLHAAMQSTLVAWRDRLIAETGDEWPDKVTAFRPEMAVHGKYGQPCPVCTSPVQRIAYADHETNYCATCQNEGQLLADRGLSRLLKGDWPKTLDQLEELKRERRR